MLNKYKRWNNILKISNDRYFDMCLSQDNTEETTYNGLYDKNIICNFNFSKNECFSSNEIISEEKYKWENAENEGVELKNIGLVGIDNGTVSYDKEEITNEQFLNILTTSEPDGHPLILNQNDMRLHLRKITGNTKNYEYKIEKNNGFISLKGGFYQGFYKLFNENYQILPNDVNDGIGLEFLIRPMDYETEKTLNHNHNNKGIFFYIGTRAENKFSLFYNGKRNAIETCEKKNSYGGEGYFIENNEEDYLIEEKCLSGITIETSEGDPVSENGIVKIVTDNKYLFFNRTKDGFNTENFNNCYDIELTIHNKELKKIVYLDDCKNTAILTDNKYLFVNRTKTGLTVNDIEKQETEKEYNQYSDIYNNAFCLFIDDNGHIGYKYLVKNCDKINNFEILSEINDNLQFVKGIWYKIFAKFISFGDKMKIMIYVNGLLKFISKDLPLFNFKELNDLKEKQEGVPYNISLGGGTQGLGESVWLNYNETFAPGLDMEKHFAGTFIGDIKFFRIYGGEMKYQDIKNNYETEKEL